MTGRWRMFVGLLCVGLAGCRKESQTAEAKDGHSGPEEAHVTVRVEAARRGTIVQTVEGLGRSEAIPAKLAMLTPAVEGHVHELVVKQGETVKKGQPIVELDQAVALADLAEKTATRDGLKASLALLKSLPRPEERRANELAVEQAKVAVERAKAAAERLRPLRGTARGFRAAGLRGRAGGDLGPAPAADGGSPASGHADRPPAGGGGRGRGKDQDGRRSWSPSPRPTSTSTRFAHRSTACSIASPAIPARRSRSAAPIGEVVDTRQVFVSVYLPAALGSGGPRRAEGSASGSSRRIRSRPARRRRGDAGLEGKVDFVGRVADAQTGNLPIRILVENPAGRLTLGQSDAA